MANIPNSARSQTACRWEYAVFDGRVDKMPELLRQLNAWGADGWELVELAINPKGMGGEKVRTAILKRPQPV